MYRLGIDIGGTKINIGFLNKANKIVYKKGIRLPENKDYENVLGIIVRELEDACAECNIDCKDILSAGIGVPGTVSEDGRIALKVPNIGWKNAEIAEEFENLTGIPTTVVQDSRAAALGEAISGAAQNERVVVCVTLGTGIGTGIVIDKKIYDGGLGGAGELGHIPVVENGRACGCGKLGCLEKYAAGLGFSITARELYGADKTGIDLFTNAKNGDEKAKNAINEAVILLGNALTSIINILSPDCLLLSGGLIKEEELLIAPLIEYVKSKCYTSADKAPRIALAELGEDAPMAGAALVYKKERRNKEIILSASIMCADMLNLGKDLSELESAGIKYLHCDIMDGHFVNNLMLPIEMLKNIRQGTKLPFDIHLMVEKPENMIPFLSLSENDIVSVHYESTHHIQRALTLIKEAGATAAVAINPGTPIEALRECLSDIGMVLIMTVNPGFAGQKLVPGSLDKLFRTRKYLDELGYSDILIEADGNCSFENIPKMAEAGADILVTGTSSVFSSQAGITENTKKIYELL